MQGIPTEKYEQQLGDVRDALEALDKVPLLPNDKVTRRREGMENRTDVDPLALTALLERALAILRARGPMRGSDLGWELWGETTAAPRRGTGSECHNKFCRPAGKVLKRLERLGKVIPVYEKTCTTWRAF